MLLERETEALSARENEKAALDKLKTVVSREKSLEAKVKATSAEYKKALEEFNKEKAYLRGQVERASTDLKVEKERATEAVDTAEVLKSKVLDLEGKVEELVEEKEQIEAFARLTARAALMRRHLRGDNPMAKAQAEVDSYLSHFGPENLDEDDAIDAEDKSPVEVEVVQKETTADAPVDTPPAVVLPTDPAQAEVEVSGADTGEATAAVVPPA